MSKKSWVKGTSNVWTKLKRADYSMCSSRMTDWFSFVRPNNLQYVLFIQLRSSRCVITLCCSVYVREYCIASFSFPVLRCRNKRTLTNSKSVLYLCFLCFFFFGVADDTLLLRMNNADDNNQTVNERVACAHNAHTKALYWMLDFPYIFICVYVIQCIAWIL